MGRYIQRELRLRKIQTEPLHLWNRMRKRKNQLRRNKEIGVAMQYDGGKHQTRILEQNVHNLVYGMFDGEGEFDIPKMHPVHIDNLADLPLQGFNYALSEKYPGRIGVHFFLHDYQFERVWRCPDRYTYTFSGACLCP